MHCSGQRCSTTAGNTLFRDHRKVKNRNQEYSYEIYIQNHQLYGLSITTMSEIRRVWWDCKCRLCLIHYLTTKSFTSLVYTLRLNCPVWRLKESFASNLYGNVCHADIMYSTTLPSITPLIKNDVQIKKKTWSIFRRLLCHITLAYSALQFGGLKQVKYTTDDFKSTRYLGFAYMITDVDKTSNMFDAAYRVLNMIFVPQLNMEKHLKYLCVINSLWSGGTHMRHTNIKIMSCRFFGAKPSSESRLSYCQLYPKDLISVAFYLQLKSFQLRKCSWQCRLRNGGYFVSASIGP